MQKTKLTIFLLGILLMFSTCTNNESVHHSVAVGDTFVINLCAEEYNNQKLEVSNLDSLQTVRLVEKTKDNAGYKDCCCGSETWKFQAIKPGQDSIRFHIKDTEKNIAFPLPAHFVEVK